MRAYFTQFGHITRLRLSRNRNTGASKHYAFIEFESPSVAKIVADSMNNYLMFGHILKCKVMPVDQVHEKMWIGANKRFKHVPWARIEGRKLGMATDREGWMRRVKTEKKRRAAKNAALREIGYEFDGEELKGVEDMPIRERSKEITGQEITTAANKAAMATQAKGVSGPPVTNKNFRTKPLDEDGSTRKEKKTLNKDPEIVSSMLQTTQKQISNIEPERPHEKSTVGETLKIKTPKRESAQRKEGNPHSPDSGRHPSSPRKIKDNIPTISTENSNTTLNVYQETKTKSKKPRKDNSESKQKRTADKKSTSALHSTEEPIFAVEKVASTLLKPKRLKRSIEEEGSGLAKKARKSKRTGKGV